MKACYECRFFRFSGGSPGYSSWTPGSDIRFGCDNNIWSSSELSGEDDFAAKIVTAENCEEFEARVRP